MNKIIDRYRKLSKVVKASIWFTICNFVIAGLGFISAPIFTHILNPEEYGKLAILMSFEHFFLIFATWEIYSGAFQKGLFKYDDRSKYLAHTAILINILTIIFFALLFLFKDYVKDFTGYTDTILLLQFVYMIFMPSYQLWMTVKKTDYEYKTVVITTIGFAVLNVIAPIVTLYTISATAIVKYQTTLIVSLLFCSVFYIANVLKKFNFRGTSEYKSQWKFMLAFQAPLIIHSVSYYLLGQSDRIMISKMCNNQDVAYYSIAYSLAMAITILQNSLNSSLTPWRFAKLKQSEYSSIYKSTNALLLIVGAAIIAFLMAVPDVMSIFFPKDYYEAVSCIPPISASVFFMFLYSIFVNIESYYEKTFYIMVVTLLCSILNILLNYWLIPIYGYMACAYTTLISYVCFALLHYIVVARIIEKKSKQIVDGKRVLYISLAFSACSLLISYIYPYPLLRYSICSALIITFIYKRKEILKLIKR